MFLRKIELSGFKSFAGKTTLDFLPACEVDNKNKNCGITVVVGPNGSGKSNIADAIQWVMGEQSMKSLRGKKSEDVIFAGSGERARLGCASATLYFDNSDKKIPLDFSEVAVSRKLFRSGESEYLVNGSRVRLIDVIDLLAKAGIGKKSYCVINQGMSDEVLNASPIERRIILEDAAGVKQFQIKKDRALKKFKSTKNNLERVRELAKEIEPHLKMLKRQADKAQKGKEISQKLKEKQTKLFSYLWNTFQNEKSGSYEEKEQLGRKSMNAQREVDKLNDAISAESKKIQGIEKQDELEKKRDATREKINNLEKELVVTEGRIELLKERQSQQKIIQSIPVDLKYVQSNLEQIHCNQEKLIKRLEGVETLRELQEIKEFARAIQQNLHKLYLDVGNREVKVEKSLIKTTEEKEAKEKNRNLQERRERITGDINLIKEEEEKLNKKIKIEIEENKKARQHLFEIERELRAKQDKLNQLKDQFSEAKIKLARDEIREEDLINEAKEDLKINIKELKYDGHSVNADILRKEIAKLKMQMEQIGGIDPMVLKEYQETNNRFDFLVQESKDLEDAIDSLKEVVAEMDKKINEVFITAFVKINKEFTKYFRVIFGGGKAKLAKTKIKSQKSKVSDQGESVSGWKNQEAENGGDNLAESENDNEESENDKNSLSTKEEIGIDISACPPGKKISNLSMLSGGERSLTSIALLFAIISFNPPPFTALDEVDSALDEANARRFNHIVKELSNNTQFIMITHNRETMRQASLLYGVTMGENGISKLLSVNLEQVGKGGKLINN